MMAATTGSTAEQYHVGQITTSSDGPAANQPQEGEDAAR